jgi:hypothetical protein
MKILLNDQINNTQTAYLKDFSDIDLLDLFTLIRKDNILINKQQRLEDYINSANENDPTFLPLKDKIKGNFPMIYPSINLKYGTELNDENYISNTDIICLDFDKIDNLKDKYDLISKDKYTNMIYYTPSKKGFKVLVKINIKISENNLEATLYFEKFWKELEKYYFSKYSIPVDSACKNMNRGQYITHCDYSIYNQNSEIFTVKFTEKEVKDIEQKLTVKKLETFGSDKILNRCYSFCERKKLNYFIDSYSEWLSFGFRLINYLGINNVDIIKHYFHLFSSLSEKYDKKECEKQILTNLKNFNDKYKYSIKVFLNELKEKGLEFTKEELKSVNINTTELGGDTNLALSLSSNVDFINVINNIIIFKDKKPKLIIFLL